MASLSRFLGPERVLEIDGTGRDAALLALVERAALHDEVDADALYSAVLERERLCSTGFGGGVAMPHVRLAGLKEFHTVLGRCKAGVPFDAIDGRPVHLIALIAGPLEQSVAYQKLMAKAARFLKAEAPRIIDAEDLVTTALEALAEH